MTALAMIIGMIPMALGLGEGGEQNAPLARAVIGGLGVATFATLFFVPLMFSVLHSQVKFSVPRSARVVIIPADALIADAQGTRVAVVDGASRVHFRNVQVGR